MYENPKKLYIRERVTCRVEIKDKVLTFEQRIQGLDGKGILISEPDLAGLELPPGYPILVRYYRRDSAYQFVSKVSGYEEQNRLRLMRIAFPTRITRYQRRKYPRAVLEGTVQARIADWPNPVRGYVRNISAGGLLCSLPKVGIFNTAISPVGRSIGLNLTLSTGDTFLEIRAEIKRVAKDTRSDTHILVHLEFETLLDRQRDKLTQITRRHG